MKSERIVLVGAGNLATSLAPALKNIGVPPVAVWSRTLKSASSLAENIGCEYSCDINSLPEADIVIISVVDSALSDVARKIALRYPHALVLHTAGSVSIDVLKEAGCKKYGIFYPMQTFSKARPVDFSTLGIFVEGCDNETEQAILCLARSLSEKVYVATSEQRRMLHLAAVFACNFSNAMYSVSEQLLRNSGLPFEVMLPLIDETAAKVHALSPRMAQTGPAARGDEKIMKAQREQLDDEIGRMYEVISEYIINNAKHLNT